LINLTAAQLDLWQDNDNGYSWPNPRILTSSVLYHAGTPITGIDYDIDRNTRHATTPSIGAHEGTGHAYDMVSDWPDVSNVTEDDTVDGAPGVYHEVAEDDVRSGAGFGANGTEYEGNVILPAESSVVDGAGFGATGTEYIGNVVLPIENDVRAGVWFGATGTEYIGNVVLPIENDVRAGVWFGATGTEYEGAFGGFDKPASPQISAAAGDGQVTIAVDAAGDNDVIYVRYKKYGDDEWSPEGPALSRVGDGNVVVSGLINFQAYVFSAYAKYYTTMSDWAPCVFAMPASAISPTEPVPEDIHADVVFAKANATVTPTIYRAIVKKARF
jgi:hypothetical protein